MMRKSLRRGRGSVTYSYNIAVEEKFSFLPIIISSSSTTAYAIHAVAKQNEKKVSRVKLGGSRQAQEENVVVFCMDFHSFMLKAYIDPEEKLLPVTKPAWATKALTVKKEGKLQNVLALFHPSIRPLWKQW